LFYCSEGNSSLARNIGLVEARAPIVLFLDDDIKITNPRFLSNHLRHYTSPSLSGVTGQILDPSGQTRATRHAFSNNPRSGWLYFPYNFDKPCSIPNGCAGNLSVRRDWAISVGGMDAQYEKGAHREESDFCLRLTQQYGNLTYDPSASLIHLAAPAGGCRNWGQNWGIHPIHHVAGEWYFILKNLKQGRLLWRDVPHHLMQLYLRQIWNSENRYSPVRISSAISRSFMGFRLARGKLKQGPRYITPDISSSYRSISILGPGPAELSARGVNSAAPASHG
jgi:GT2 family glycosyltransferase